VDHDRAGAAVLIRSLALATALLAAPGAARAQCVLAPGAAIAGEAADDHAGWSVAELGDVDGNGLHDLLVGAPNHDGNAGRVYVLFGRGAGWPSQLTGADVVLDAENTLDHAGWSVAGAGDVDADGLHDLLVGAPFANAGGADRGETYLVLGRAAGWIALSDVADGEASFVGEDDFDEAGYAVAGGGDLDGDGYDDLLISAPLNDDAGGSAGQVYVVFGRDSGWAHDLVLDDPGAAEASFLGAAAYDQAGYAVAGGGDVDGDGLDDLLIGAPFNDDGGTSAGQAYVVLGRETAWSQDAPLTWAAGSFTGELTNDQAGVAVTMAGDVDGDGLDDLLIGAPYASGASAYLVLGRAGGWSPQESLAGADASFVGSDASGLAGWALSGAGDVDGDGYDDLLVGEPGVATAWLVHGRHATEWGPDLLLPVVGGSLEGTAGDQTGRALAGAGDVDGDGLDDMLIGSSHSDGAGLNASGLVHVVFGFLDSDGDGDGYTGCDGDCDDTDPGIHPGAADDPCDGLDTDCDGNTFELLDSDGDGWSTCEGDCDDGDAWYTPEDADGDGFSTCEADCDDGDGATWPGAPELCDGIDNDCDGAIPWTEDDADLDGWTPCDGDCDDTEPTVHPWASELCDGLDNDCDGAAQAGEVDADGDGWMLCQGDCDDGAPGTYPGAADTLCDGVDTDCDGFTGELDDADGDGYSPCDGDCDDADAAVNPDATETCNGVDDDCDGTADEVGADGCTTYYLDQDADGWGQEDDSECLCAPTGRYTATQFGDCDDTRPTVNPGHTEICDGLDNDCDEVVDPEDSAGCTVFFCDRDDDGHPAQGDHQCTCGPEPPCDHPGAGNWDCNDDDAGMHPYAPEACDGLDNDCDHGVDEGFDLDGDGYDSCVEGDCDDESPWIHPGAAEIPYDGVDSDCDGTDLTDVDGDGHDGGPLGTDCDDVDATAWPGAPELCTDGLDSDCDGDASATEPGCEQGGCSCSTATGPRTTGAVARLALAALLLAALHRRRR